MLFRKLLISCRLAAVLCFPCLALADSSIPHLSLSFSETPAGELPISAGVPWRISSGGEGEFTATVVSDEEGGAALHLKSGTKGSISFSTRTNNAYQTRSLNAHPGRPMEWSFDWKIPEGGNVDQLTLIRLDDGTAAAGHYLAGFGLTRRGLVQMINADFEPVSQQMMTLPTSAISAVPGKWYRTTVQLLLSEDNQVTTTLAIHSRDGGDALYTSSATFTPSRLNPSGVVRVLVSVTEGTDLLLSNLRLSSL